MPIFSGLEGKRVLITGTSGGIGRSMSYLFSKSGATLGLHYNENKIDKSKFSRVCLTHILLIIFIKKRTC